MPEQYLTPPPPHELLTAKHSFYARSGLFFLFFVALVFALVFAPAACNGGGGGSSSSKMQDPSSDDDNGSSDDLNIVFSSVDNTADTVIGMREFLLTVTYNNLTEKDSLVFIVGESADAPAWSAVENHPAKITRNFDNAEKQSREIYFSVTEKFPGYNEDNSFTTIDLSNDNGNEVAYMRQQAPGIMVPGQSYYVHIYRDGQYLKTSPAVTLLDYPKASDLPAQVSTTNNVWANDPFAHPSVANYSFRMDMWLKPGSDTSFRDLEMRAGDVGLLPVRMIVPIDPDNPPTELPDLCSTGGTILGSTVQFNIKIFDQTNDNTILGVPTRAVVPTTTTALYRTINNPISFDQDEMVDGFFAAVPTSEAPFLAGPVNYTAFVLLCFSGGGLNSISWKVSLTE